MTDREPVNIMGVIAFPNPDTHIKNVLILFFIQRTEKRSLGGECHALPI